MSDTEAADEARLMRREDAKAAQQHHLDSIEQGNEAAIQSAQVALRTLYVMQGGAIVSMLAFISALLGQSELRPLVPGLVEPLLYFAIGLALCAGASCGAYVTNYLHAAHSATHEFSWEHPYVLETKASKRYARAGNAAHVLSLLLALASLVLFVVGFLDVSAGISGFLK